jgi:hypothetical protein
MPGAAHLSKLKSVGARWRPEKLHDKRPVARTLRIVKKKQNIPTPPKEFELASDTFDRAPFVASVPSA